MGWSGRNQESPEFVRIAEADDVHDLIAASRLKVPRGRR